VIGEVERGKRNISFMGVVKIAKATGTTAASIVASAGL
jgi:hypothetical protein